MKRLMRYIVMLSVAIVATGSLRAQQSLNRIRMQDDFGHVMLLQGPSAGFGTNWTLRFPSHSDSLGAILYESDNDGQLAWLKPGANGQVLTLSGGVPVWSNAASGSVSSIAMTVPSFLSVTPSSITTSGTFAVSLATESANTVFAAPNGSSGTPTFRTLVAADIPSLNYVTSVGLSLPSIFTVSGSPVTSSGTLGATLASQSANLVFAAPNGSAGTPTFRSLVAADISNLSSTDWQLVGNAIASAWNGTSGSFLGTTSTQPLVLATTNTTTPQPIEFYTNNAEKMRLASTGELGIGLTPTSGRLLHVAGTAGTANVRMASLSSAMSASTGGLVFADANGDLNRLAAPSSPNQVLTSTTGGVLSWTSACSGSGGVSSVGLSMPSIFSVSNSPVTTSGTLTASLNTQSANRFFAGPSSGGAATPTFRSLDAADLNGVAWTTTGNTGTTAWNGTSGNFLGTTDAQALSIATTNSSAQDIKFFTGASGASERVRITGTTGRVGVNTTSPNVKLDVNGGFAIRSNSLTLSSGTNNNVTIGDSSNYRISGPSSNFSITGLTGGTDGKKLTLFNASAKSMTLSHLNSGSTSANQIWNPARTDMQISDSGMVDLVYDATMSKWIVQSTSGGVNGLSNRLIVRKSADQDDNTGGSLIDDNELKFTAQPNTWYQIECMIIDSGTSTGSIAIAGVSVPSGTDAEMIVFGGADGNQQQDINMLRLGTNSTGTGTQVNIAGIRGFVRFTGAIITGSNGGTVTFRWSTNKAGKTIRVFKESYLVVQSAIKL